MTVQRECKPTLRPFNNKAKNKAKFANKIRKSPESVGIQGFSVAAGEGFEPSHTESESAVLPLHKPAILCPQPQAQVVL